MMTTLGYIDTPERLCNLYGRFLAPINSEDAAVCGDRVYFFVDPGFIIIPGPGFGEQRHPNERTFPNLQLLRGYMSNAGAGCRQQGRVWWGVKEAVSE